jgi:branched-chain amino acid transport system ATP-binding protein
VLLKLQNVSAGYGSRDVVSGIDLSVNQGEIVALLGANGAGKSTLLKAISGLLPLSGGIIEFRGTGIGRLPAASRVREGIVHVPEGRQTFSGMTVAQNLLLGAYTRRRDGHVSNRLSEVLRAFPALESRLKTIAGNLSGGQQQMLAIARGLMASPSLMLLDEPSLGLSPKLVGETFDLIRSLKDRGISILLSEQNARLSLAIAGRGYVLENGRITLEGQGHALLNSKDVAEKYLGVGAGNQAASSRSAGELARRLRELNRSASQ